MLARPSVTPKDCEDYRAGYSKRMGDTPAPPSLDQPRNTVRFHPHVDHIADPILIEEEREVIVEEGGRKEAEEEDFPLRKRAIKGRKQTGFAFSKQGMSSTGALPLSFNTPRQMKSSSSLESPTQSYEEAEFDTTINSSKANKVGGISMGMASKIVGAFKPKSKTSTSFPQTQGFSTNSIDARNARSGEVADSTTVNSMSDAIAPVFAEGISLFQPTTTYKSKESKSDHHKNSLGTKHGFARIVEAARHHSKTSGSKVQKRGEEGGVGGEEQEVIDRITPATRNRLLELAQAAKSKTQQKTGENGDVSHRSLSSRDEEPSWKCAGLDPFVNLQGSIPLSSLTTESAAVREKCNGKGRHKESRRNRLPSDEKQKHSIRKSVSRHRLTEDDQTQRFRGDDVVWIGRDGQEQIVEEKELPRQCTKERSNPQSRSRYHQEDEERHTRPSRETRRHGTEDKDKLGKELHQSIQEREHHRQSSRHRHHHASSSGLTTNHRTHAAVITPGPAIKQNDQAPDKRKGKVLNPGAETSRLNLALTMVRTRMEMEIAERHEVEANTKHNGMDGMMSNLMKDDEEKAWLDEAYEEAVKREVECQYLYDAHALGSTW